MQRRSVWLRSTPALLLALSGVVVVGDESPAPPVPMAASADDAEISKLIDVLDRGTFLSRNDAEEKLYRAGRNAIPQLTRAAINGNPETTSRLARILRRIYLAEDRKIGDPAAEALDDLSLKLRVGAADTALQTIESEREKRAIERLGELGAKIRMEVPIDEESATLIDQVRLDEQWKGGDEGLKHFTHLTTRQKFMVTIVDGSNVTPDAAQRIQTDLPFIQIQMRGSATLGIGPDPFPEQAGCVIGRVLPNNAASKAGLLIGDRVDQIDETKVETFEDLVSYLRKKKVGEQVKLKIDRRGEKQELTATLESWKSIDEALPMDQAAPRFFAPPPRPAIDPK